MERRLCEPSLAKMKFPFAGQETIAQQAASALESPALREILLVRNEHIANEVGIVDEIQVLRTDLVVHDVAVFAMHGEHRAEWIARHFPQELSGIPRSWTGRESIQGRP